MQPAPITLRLIQGATFRDTLRLCQGLFVYKPIQAISATGPVRLTVADHGLATDWPVWVREVRGLLDINREPVRVPPWPAIRVDADTLEINALSAAGKSPAGGELVYQPPVDLTGCSARMQIRDKPGGRLLLELSSGSGLTLEPAGALHREISAEQTAALDFQAAVYDLEVTFADGTVQRWAEGEVVLSPQVTV
jgi:hypothetical protein